MSKSLSECHQEIVEKLLDRGERLFVPRGIDPKWGCSSGEIPHVYVKGRPFPSTDNEEFICGHAVEEKDGTITIFYDMLAYQRGPFDLEELGLCPAQCWYKKNEKVKNVGWKIYSIVNEDGSDYETINGTSFFYSETEAMNARENSKQIVVEYEAIREFKGCNCCGKWKSL